MHIGMGIYFRHVSVRSISSISSRHTCEGCSMLISKALSFSSLRHDLNWCDFGCLEIILVICWLDFSTQREFISWLLLWNTPSSLLLHGPLLQFPGCRNSGWDWSTRRASCRIDCRVGVQNRWSFSCFCSSVQGVCSSVQEGEETFHHARNNFTEASAMWHGGWFCHLRGKDFLSRNESTHVIKGKAGKLAWCISSLLTEQKEDHQSRERTTKNTTVRIYKSTPIRKRGYNTRISTWSKKLSLVLISL